jgi:hypothetical protein
MIPADSITTESAAASPAQIGSRAPVVILAGPWHHAEFAYLLNSLDAKANWPTAPTLAAAVDHLRAAETPPDLILLAQPRPGLDEQADIDCLASLAPLTRIIVVAGAWCEGELRTGRPLTGVVRLYWYEFLAWLRAATKQLVAGASPPWSEPLTEIRAGQWLRYDRSHAAGALGREYARTIAIASKDIAVFEALEAGLKSTGWNCIWAPRHRAEAVDASAATEPSISVAIWDGAQLDRDELESLRAFCTGRQDQKAPVLALLDFPRAEHIQLALTVGVAAVMAKPYQLGLLSDELSRLAVEPS